MYACVFFLSVSNSLSDDVCLCVSVTFYVVIFDGNTNIEIVHNCIFPTPASNLSIIVVHPGVRLLGGSKRRAGPSAIVPQNRRADAHQGSDRRTT